MELEILFSISHPGCDRIYHVTQEDVRVVLARLPSEVKIRLRAVHFNDRARGNRGLGYVNRGRREIALCALPPRMSLTRFLVPGQSPDQFGAKRGHQWPTLAIRRFILYDVFLHELGHLQIFHPKEPQERRKFSMETKAQEFAMEWCSRLWADPFDHPDAVHNKPTPEELSDEYPETTDLLRRIRQDPNDAQLFQRLALVYHQRSMAEEERAALDKSLFLDPNDPWTNFYLGAWYYSRKDFPAAIKCYERGLVLSPACVAYWCLAEAYEAHGLTDLANLYYQKAVEVEPTNKVARKKLRGWKERSIAQ